jgi:DNA-binding transcriptional regulator GbsR (MarR family)
MTEINDTIDRMPAAVQRFILKWGDMGSQWGVNRSVAQIHALLYISETPLNAEQISHTLGIARSNVSNSLKELQSWRIIERVPIPGDRRDHFTAETDVWEIAVRIAAVRKQREIDPALDTLDLCVKEAADDSRVSAQQRERIGNMQKFVHAMDHWYGQMLTFPPATLLRMVRMGDKIVSMLGLSGKKKEYGA